MRLLAFLIFLFFGLYALVARWYFVCIIKQQCESVKTEEVDSSRMKNLTLKDGNRIILENYDQFAFEEGAVVPQLNANNEMFLDSVAHYLKQFPAQNLNITAFYRESEKGLSSGMFENLGIARAAEIRRLLVQRGIEESRITLDYGTSEDPALRAPLLFEAYLPSDNPGDYDKIAFTFKRMTFNEACFPTDSDVFRPGKPFLLYADSVKAYLKLNPQKNMTIVGHADSRGTDQYNLDLGHRRARSAK